MDAGQSTHEEKFCKLMNGPNNVERSLNHIYKQYKMITGKMNEVILKSCEATDHVNSVQMLVAYRDGRALSLMVTTAQQKRQK